MSNQTPTPVLYALPQALVLHVPGGEQAGVIPADKWTVQVLDGVPHQVYIVRTGEGDDDQWIATVALVPVTQLQKVQTAGQGDKTKTKLRKVEG